MFEDSELYNVHVKSANMEMWSIWSSDIDYGEYNKKCLPSRV